MTLVKYQFEDGTIVASYSEKCKLEETKGKATVIYIENANK